MATLNEIRFNILDALSGGRSVQDSPFSLEQIGFFVRYYRHLLIRRDTNYWKRAEGLVQDLGSVEVEITQPDVSRINDAPRAILRTAVEIPELVRLRRRPALTYVGTADQNLVYPHTVDGAIRYQSHARYTPDRSRSYVEDGHVYVTSDVVAEVIDEGLSGETVGDLTIDDLEGGITSLNIRGIFAHPERAYAFRTGEKYDPDTEYPGMPEDMIQRITQSVINGEGRAMIQSILDTEADHLPVNQQPQDNEEAPASAQ